MVDFGKKLISNTAFLLLDWFSVAIFSFLFWIVVARFLTAEDYGIVATVVNASIIISSISFFGLGTAVFKLIPEYLQLKKTGKAYALIRFSFKLVFLVNLAVAVVLVIFSGQIAPILKLQPIHVILIGILTLATSLANFSSSVLQGFQDMKWVSITDSVGYIVKAVGSFLLLFLFLSNLVPILVFTVALFIIFILRYNRKWFSKIPGEIDYKEIMNHYAFPTFLGSIAWMIFNNAQYLILTIIKDPSATGVFSVAAVVTTLIAVIPNTIANAFFPLLSQLSVGKSFRRKREFYVSMNVRYALFIAIPLAMAFILFPGKIVVLFSRTKYLGAIPLFPILSIAALMNGLGIMFSNNLYAVGKIKLYRNIVAITAILFLLVSIGLTEMFSAMGLSVAYALTMIFFFSSSFYYLKKMVNFKIKLLDVIKIAVSSSVWIVFFNFTSVIISNSILQIVYLAVSAIVYLLLLLPLRFYRKEDIRILDYARIRLPKSLLGTFDKLTNFIIKFT